MLTKFKNALMVHAALTTLVIAGDNVEARNGVVELEDPTTEQVDELAAAGYLPVTELAKGDGPVVGKEAAVEVTTVDTQFYHPAKVVALIFRGQIYHLNDGKLTVTDATPHETQELLDKGFRVLRPADVAVTGS